MGDLPENNDLTQKHDQLPIEDDCSDPKSSDAIYSPQLRQLSRELHWLEKLNVFVQITLVVVGLLAVFVYRGQLTTMSEQLNEMKESGRQTENLLMLYQQQLRELSAQAKASEKLAQQAAAQSMAMNALAVNSSTELEMRDRAWLTVEPTVQGLEFPPDPSAPAGMRIPIIFHIRNIGLSTATNVSFVFDLRFWQPQQRPIEHELGLCKTAESLSTTKPNWRGFFSIFPSGVYTSQEYLAGDRHEMEGAEFKRPEYSKETFVSPIVTGCIDYQYGASRRHHKTGFIYQVHGFGQIMAESVIVGRDLQATQIEFVPLVWGGGDLVN